MSWACCRTSEKCQLWPLAFRAVAGPTDRWQLGSTSMAVPGSQWAGRRPEFVAVCGPSASVTSQGFVPPVPLPSSCDLISRAPGESQGSPPLLPGSARHSHLFFVSRMNRRKRRPSTRNTHCRRPRRSARCRHPTCRLWSESPPLSLPLGLLR